MFAVPVIDERVPNADVIANPVTLISTVVNAVVVPKAEVIAKPEIVTVLV
jgi:hypothetical protein